MKKIKIVEIMTCDKTKHFVRYVEHGETILAFIAKAEKNGQKWIEFLEEKTQKPFLIRLENITSIKAIEVFE